MHNVARAKQKPERVGKPEAWPTANGRSEAEPPFGGGFCFSAEWLGLVRLAVQCMRNNRHAKLPDRSLGRSYFRGTFIFLRRSWKRGSSRSGARNGSPSIQGR
jgi:hypothetical protein